MNTNEFFESVYKNELYESDMHNYIGQITDDFEPEKLQRLCGDFDEYLWRKIELLDIEKNPGQAVYVSDFFWGATKQQMIDIAEDSEQNIFISKKFKGISAEQLKDLQKLEADEITFDEYYDKYSFPTELYFLQKLRNLLVDLKRKHTSAESKFDDKPIGTFNPHNQKHNSDKSETVNFFESIESGELLKLDIHNEIQKLTDEYDEDKLNLLCDEFDSYIFVKYENWRASYSEGDVHKRIDKYHDKGIKLPIKGDEKHKYQWPFIRDFFLVERYGKPISDEEHEKHLDELFGEDRNKNDVIDDNVLLGGFYYATDNKYLQDLRDILVKLKKKYTSSVYRFDDKPEDLQVNNNYISWIKSDESLKQFIKALKEQNLIKSRDTEAIINYHFKPHREQNSKPQPIEWLDNQNLLVYLFRNLYKKYFINPAGKKWQLVTEHFIKSNGDQFKSGTLGTEAGKQKDGALPANGTNTIDTIVDRLIAD